MKLVIPFYHSLKAFTCLLNFPTEKPRAHFVYTGTEWFMIDLEFYGVA